MAKKGDDGGQGWTGELELHPNDEEWFALDQENFEERLSTLQRLKKIDLSEKITSYFSYSCKMQNLLGILAKHAFVVLRTEGGDCWSLEKHDEAIVAQKGSSIYGGKGTDVIAWRYEKMWDGTYVGDKRKYVGKEKRRREEVHKWFEDLFGGGGNEMESSKTLRDVFQEVKIQLGRPYALHIADCWQFCRDIRNFLYSPPLDTAYFVTMPVRFLGTVMDHPVVHGFWNPLKDMDKKS